MRPVKFKKAVSVLGFDDATGCKGLCGELFCVLVG